MGGEETGIAGWNSEALLWKEAETVAVSEEMICVLLVNLRKPACWFEAGNDVMKNSWFLKEMRIAEMTSSSRQEGMKFSLQWRIEFNRSTVHLVTARKIGRKVNVDLKVGNCFNFLSKSGSKIISWEWGCSRGGTESLRRELKGEEELIRRMCMFVVLGIV